MKKIFVILGFSGLFLTGCAQQNHAEVLTEKCVEDGLNLEGCECIVQLMEEHLEQDDIKDLSKATQSGDNSDSNFGKIEDEIRKKLQDQMDKLPPLERIKKGSEVGLGLANCGPKLL